MTRDYGGGGYRDEGGSDDPPSGLDLLLLKSGRSPKKEPDLPGEITDDEGRTGLAKLGAYCAGLVDGRLELVPSAWLSVRMIDPILDDSGIYFKWTTGQVKTRLWKPSKTTAFKIEQQPKNSSDRNPLWPDFSLFFKGGDTIPVCEGETDAIVGTYWFEIENLFTPGSATMDLGEKHFRLMYACGGRHIPIIYDADRGGRAGAERTAEAAAAYGLYPSFVDIDPILRQIPKYTKDLRDIARYIEVAEGKRLLHELLEKARPKVVSFLLRDRIAEEDSNENYVWEGVFAAGALNIIFGLGKKGKSDLIHALISASLDEKEFLERATVKNRTIYFSEQPKKNERENYLEKYYPNLIDSDEVGDLTLSYSFDERYRGKSWVERWPLMQAEIEEYGAKLIVIDSFRQWTGIRGKKEWDGELVGSVLEQLKQYCADTGVTIILVHHMAKNKDADDPAGSAEFVNVPEQVVWFHLDPKNKERRLLSVSGRLPICEIPFEWDINERPVLIEPAKVEIVGKKEAKVQQLAKGPTLEDLLLGVLEESPGVWFRPLTLSVGLNGTVFSGTKSRKVRSVLEASGKCERQGTQGTGFEFRVGK